MTYKVVRVQLPRGRDPLFCLEDVLKLKVQATGPRNRRMDTEQGVAQQ